MALGPPSFFTLIASHSGTVEVSPELGGADDIAVFVRRHEAVLLAGDADAGDGRAVDFLEDGEDDLVERFDPGGRCCSMCPTGRFGIGLVGRARSATTLPDSRSSTMALVLCVPLSMPMKRLMGWYWDLMGVADRDAKPGKRTRSGVARPATRKRPRERTAASVANPVWWSASAFQRREARDAAHAFLDRLVGGGVAEAQAIVGAKRTAGNRGDLLLLEELLAGIRRR